MNSEKEGNPTKKKTRIIIRDDKDSSEVEADGMTAKEVQGVQNYLTNCVKPSSTLNKSPGMLNQKNHQSSHLHLKKWQQQMTQFWKF